MNKGSTNRILALLLVILMAFTQMPFTAFAEESGTDDSIVQEQDSAVPDENENKDSDQAIDEDTDVSDSSEQPDSDTEEPEATDEPTVTPGNLTLGSGGSISGALWLDIFEDIENSVYMGDGTRQTEEQPLAGYTVSLYPESDTANPVQTATTDADGAYTFANLEPGSYIVGVTAATIDGTAYLLPMAGITGDNKFCIDTETYSGAYTATIEIGEDTAVTGMDAGMRTSPGVQPRLSVPENYIYDVSEGKVTIQEGSSTGTLTVTYGASPQTTTPDFSNTQPITIIDTWNGTLTADDSVIEVNGVTAYITLDNVDIDVSGTADVCAFKLVNGADVTLTLSGTNTLCSGEHFSGLYAPAGNTLTINAADTNQSLTANGGNQAAGIGGGWGRLRRHHHH